MWTQVSAETKRALCVWKTMYRMRENCKFIVRGGEYEKPKLKEDKWIEEKWY